MSVSSILVSRLGWTLLHSLWQILAIACVVGIVLSVLSRRAARLRYAIACAGLAAVYVPLVATFYSVTFRTETFRTETIEVSNEQLGGSSGDSSEAATTPPVADSQLPRDGAVFWQSREEPVHT
jgi:hypothetical protein